MGHTGISDQRAFRNALGHFTTGVTVVSGLLPDRAPCGATVNSFSAVSLDPPLVLFSLRKDAACLSSFAVGAPFAVSVLASQHAHLSSHFATPRANKWDTIAYATWDSGCPIIDDALAAFEGQICSHYEAGDHVVVFGQVSRMAITPDVTPLVFFCGKYTALHCAEPSASCA